MTFHQSRTGSGTAEGKGPLDRWAIGVDLGGTKVEIARVDSEGRVLQRIRRPTDVADGPAAVEAEIVTAVRLLEEGAGSAPIGIGVGAAGEIAAGSGVVRFSPNLGWHEVAIQQDLHQALGLPVVVTNDVRAIAWGEWLHGAGRGYRDLVCLFVGTGIGGGVVSGGQMLVGGSNTAAEVGHMIIDMHGPLCHCGNRGCLETLAGGWAIPVRAREAIAADATAGAPLLRMAGGRLDSITAETVTRAAHAGDPLAARLIEEVTQALIAGAISIVHAFNPSCLILGGGVIGGLPELIGRVEQGVRQRALKAATEGLRIVPAELRGDAGVIGAAALAMRWLGEGGVH